MRRQEIARHLCQQILVGEVTTGVQKHAFAVMDDEKLIGLNAFTLYQIGELNTFMDTIIVDYRAQCPIPPLFGVIPLTGVCIAAVRYIAWCCVSASFPGNHQAG